MTPDDEMQSLVGPRPVFADDPVHAPATARRLPWRIIALGASELAGFGALVAGVSLASIPAALIVGGLGVILAVEALDRKRPE